MLSRALNLATVMLLVGCFQTPLAEAQNLEAGKSPSQIFAATCTVCHKGARGLVKTVPPGSLPGFLRQHYTTSPAMASAISAYLLSNGAADPRYRAEPPREHPKDMRSPPGEPERAERTLRERAPEAERPKDNRPAAQEERESRKGHHGKRLARPAHEAPAGVKPGEERPAAEAAPEHEQEGRKPTRREKLTRRGKHAPVEPPKSEPVKNESPMGKGDAAVAKPEVPKGEAAKPEEPKSAAPSERTAEPESAKPEATKPESSGAEAGKSTAPPEAKPATAGPASGGSQPPSTEGSKSNDTPKPAGPVRADPVPSVTPAPKPDLKSDLKPDLKSDDKAEEKAGDAGKAAATVPDAASKAETSPVSPPPPSDARAAKPESKTTDTPAASSPSGSPVPPISK